MQETKVCKICQQNKPVSEFFKSGKLKGVQYYKSSCRQCSWSEGERKRRQLFAQGLIECTICERAQPLDNFYDDSRRMLGKRSECKGCVSKNVLEYRRTEQGKQVYQEIKRRYRSSSRGKRTQREYAQAGRQERRWYPQERARQAVHDAIRRNGFPKPTRYLCTDCGVQAEEYHHESYEREHWLDVIPLCVGCHKKRHQPKQEAR